MTTTEKTSYKQRYPDHDESDHRLDFMSEARADPNLKYFQDQLHVADPATAHRLAHAGKLTGTDTAATAERLENVIEALHSTRADQSLDEKEAKKLADQVTQGMTAFHDRERDRLDFMADKTEYELPKTPRQEELLKFENHLKHRGLDYVKDDNGDITVTFPTNRMRDEVLSNVPKGFARQATKDEKTSFESKLTEQKVLENTIVFKAEDDEETKALQGQLLADEMARRAKYRSNRITQLLEHATSDKANEDDDDDNEYAGKSPQEIQEDIAHKIADLLHQQYEDDNKTMLERLADVPVPDPTSNYPASDLTGFKQEDFISRQISSKVDYNLQLATEALDDNEADPALHEAGTAVINRVARTYHATLTKFADEASSDKFLAYQHQLTEVGNALHERVSQGESLLQDSLIEPPQYQAAATLGDPGNIPGVQEYLTDVRQALADHADELPQYVNVVSGHILRDITQQATAFEQYADDIANADPLVLKHLDTQTHKSIEELNWLLQK